MLGVRSDRVSIKDVPNDSTRLTPSGGGDHYQAAVPVTPSYDQPLQV